MPIIVKKFSLHTGRNVDVSIEVDIVVDNNYGTDADGNRGCMMTFLDGFRYTMPDGLVSEECKEVDSLVGEYIDCNNFWDDLPEDEDYPDSEFI